MARWSNERGATFRWQQSQRPVAASIEELLTALARLHAEAAALADRTYVAIQHHSYLSYAAFRAKLDEHSALVTVIRSRLSRSQELRNSDGRRIAARVDAEEHEILVLIVSASLKFSFALSANPSLPLGARETFISEIDALEEVGRALGRMPPDKLPANTLEDVETARLILQEVIDKSPPLADLDYVGAAAAPALAAMPIAA